MNNAEPHINMDTTYFLSADGHREDPDRFGQLDSSNGSVNQKPIEPDNETCNKDKYMDKIWIILYYILSDVVIVHKNSFP